ncbi:FG-GAP-like repeat-containing protein [Cohnella sp. GCM10012308]|uniref:FG-GAP-like repeat-containing protein n=1 Tax=Cohnella sp. GCM10012308 TaxID=3317329 RepID=UPI0036194C15
MRKKLAALVSAGLSLAMAAAPFGAFAAGPKFQSASSAYSLSAGSSINDIAFADLDGDGHLDAIANDNFNNRIAIFKGNGDGTLQPAHAYLPVGQSPREIAVADLNADGHLDIAVTSYSDDAVSIFLGQGGGTFGPRAAYPAGDGPNGIAAADLDGDGLVDLAIACNDNNRLAVLYGNGNGTFSAPVQSAVGTYPRRVIARDFNKDGRLDLAVANDGSGNISVMLNNGDRTFNITNFAGLHTPTQLVSGDFNGDGHLDLATAENGNDGAAVLLGLGNGSFGPASYYSSGAGTQPVDIAMGDFDGDGHLDLAVTNQINTISILNGNADGTFQPKNDLPVKGFVASGDLNEDGLADLAYGSGNSLNLLTSRAEGALAFSAPTFSVLENAGNAIVTIERTGSSYGRTTVRLQTSDGTAVAGTDYTAVDARIVFSAGETTKTYSIPVLNDSDYRSDRTFDVTISGPTNEATMGTQTSATVTIQEDDPAPDTTAPTIDAAKFAAVDNYSGTQDRLAGAAGAVGEPGADVRAFRWNDDNSDGIVDAGELGSEIALGTSAADGSVPGADIGDLSPGTYKYVVSAEDAASNESPRTAAAAVTVTLTKGLTPDVADPTWPAGAELADTNLTRTGVKLSWPAAADDRGVNHYELTQDGDPITSPDAATLFYDVSGLTAGTTYAFAVVAVDAAGNRSASLSAMVATAPLVDPAKFSAVDNYVGTPDQLIGTAGAIGRSGATVRAYRWNDADSDGIADAGELGAAIALGTSGADGSVAAADLGDLAAGTYKFIVTATDGAGVESPRSAAAAVSVTLTNGIAPDIAAPTWPSGAELSISAVTYDSVKLDWPAAGDDRGVDHYELTLDGESPVALDAATLSRAIGDLIASTNYTFSIIAIDTAGNRSAALTATATTLPQPATVQPPQASGEARLKLLTFIGGAQAIDLTPAFDMNVLAYEAETFESRITLNVESLAPAAIVLINGKSTIGKLPFDLDLDSGSNIIQISVRAANGIVREYTVTIDRQSKPPAIACFADIRGHWAESEINDACEMGLVQGGPDGLFRPDGLVTRAEWAVMLARWLKTDINGVSGDSTFADAAGIPAWAREAIASAVENGILNGYPDGTFRPSLTINRAETAATFVRAAKWTLDSAAVTSFADDASIPAWAKPYAAAAATHGILSGKNDNRFDPFAPTTRAEAAAMFVRLSKLFNQL